MRVWRWAAWWAEAYCFGLILPGGCGFGECLTVRRFGYWSEMFVSVRKVFARDANNPSFVMKVRRMGDRILYGSVRD